MKARAYLFFVVFWICCAPIHIFAQQKELVSRLYTMKDGLPDQLVNTVMQDSHGFIWVGTSSGLSKFDGMRFTTYRNNPSSTNSLRSNQVSGVLEDKMGRIWIGHAQGLDLFDPRTERFYFHWPDTGSKTNSFHVGKLLERRDGKIWICTDQGVYVAEPETLNIEKFPQIPRETADIAETDDGSVVAVCWDRGVYYMDARTGETTQFPNATVNPKGIGDQFIRSVTVDKMNRIWIGTPTGLVLFNPSQISFTHYPTEGEVVSIEENPDGQILLGCGAGLYIFDPENGKIDKLASDPGVLAMTIDSQGTLWTSSYKGLWQRHTKSKQLTIHSEFGQTVGSIVEDVNGEIWFFGADKKDDYWSSTLIKLNPNLGTVSTNQVTQLDPRTKLGTGSLFLDGKKNMMVTYKRILGKYISESQTFETFEIKGPYAESITCFMDSHGTIWFGGWAGITRFDSKTVTNKKLTAFAQSTVHSFLEDSSKNLWIGSTAGLTRYNLTTGKLDLFSHQSDDPHSLSSNIVYHLVMDSDKNIWVGTGGGLNKMIKGTENDVPRFLNWRTTKSGLPNDDVYCVVDGGDGTLWMTCGNMISHFNPKQNTFRNYDNGDGLSGENFRGLYYLNGRGLKSRDGTIYFGSLAGVVVFHPDSLQDNPFIPPLAITGFSIHNKTVPVAGTGADTLTWETPLTQSISYTNEIQLTYDQNDFNIEFAALNFVNPERNQYKYKLEPYEKHWIETNADSRFARYTNISPGRYTFRVIGSNNDGVWNEEGATLVIVIAPPWWKTWWAYSLYAIAAIVIFFSLRRYDINRVVLKHRAEQLSELDTLKTRFFANISHEFRTPITLILGPLKEMYNGTFKGDQKATLGVMMRNGRRLLRLINQLLDLSKLEVGKMSLQASQTNLVQVLKEIASAHESSAEGKKIKFTLYFEVENLILFIDQEKIEKIMHNILSNAFKFTKENGEVILHLKVENDLQAVISIKDTGIGIPSHELDKVFDRFYQVDSSQTRGYEGSGLGMALAKELVELHHGTISVESIEGTGSTFTVRLPLGKEHLRKEEIIDTGEFRKTKVDAEDLKAMENILTAENRIEKITNPSDHQPVLLIVEDNADMRHYISKTLSDQYQIIEADNGKTGVTLAKESVPDLIISDIMMPEMDGYKLCEIIKTNELTSHIPVILLTAKADRESKLAGLEIGADDYLSKPFDADELKLIVRNRIEERRKLRERFSREITLEPKQISITSLDEKFLTKVLAIIEEHMDDETFSIDELSREGGYSNMQFYRKIKALAGQTPSQFLRTIRLKRAAELLSKNSDNVTQIAYSVGFNSLSYFNKCFKEQFGVTPGQFADESVKSKV